MTLASYDGPGKPNNVKVTVDGALVDNVDFGASFGPKDYAFADSTIAHSWKVEIDAKGTGYDKLGANAFTGTSTPCAPTPKDGVDCTAIKFVKGSALDGSNYINATFIQNGVSFQMNAEINEVQAQDAAVDGPTHLYVLVHAPGGDQKYPLTKAERDSGIFTYTYSSYLTGSWTVDWIQYDGHNDHFTGELQCGPVTTPDAAAAVTITPATCSTPEALVLGAPTNATWGTPTATSGPNDTSSAPTPYSVTATAGETHTFPGGSSTLTLTGSLAGILPPTGSCAPPCITKANVSYTYFPNSNSGVVTVNDVVGSSHVLCQPFWVTATSWKYTTNQVWPQVRDVVQYVNTPYTDGVSISAPGTYPYVAAVTCGQGDIYASFSAQPEPTETLTAPGKPFVETFLHNMGFATTTPGNTWVQQTPGCNQVTVVTPTATAITECGTYGSVSVPADTASIDYTLVGDGKTGHNVVTAAPIGAAVLVGYPAGGWSFELGSFVECQVNPKVTMDLGACYPDGFDKDSKNPTYSSKNVTFTFDNTKSDVPVQFVVANASPAISETVPAHTSKDVAGGPVTNSGGSYDVVINGDAANPVHLTVTPFPNCFDGGGVPADPSHTDQICVSGVVTDGSITVDVKPSLIYTVTNTDTHTVYPTDANGKATVPAGHYEVTVVAAPGFVVTGIDNWKYVVEILAPKHCELVAVPDIPKSSITCFVDGSYTLPVANGVDWFVGGVKTEPGKYPVKTATMVNITAEPTDATFGFVADSKVAWDLEFVAPTGCDLTTHPLVTPAAVTSTQPTCLSDGSYTIPATTGVLYSINGVVVPTGTTTVKGAQSITVTAAAIGPDYGLEANVQTSWPLTFGAKPTDCLTQLTTLAVTGVSVGGGLAFAAGLVMLGIAGIFVRRRFIADK